MGTLASNAERKYFVENFNLKGCLGLNMKKMPQEIWQSNKTLFLTKSNFSQTLNQGMKAHKFEQCDTPKVSSKHVSEDLFIAALNFCF